MRNHRIYINHTLQPGSSISLDKDASHYINTVLRLKSGFTVRIFNDQGEEYQATVNIHKKNCEITVGNLTRNVDKPEFNTHLIQAIARGDHMDFAVQKATELGVGEITPVISQRTQNHDKARLQKRFTHWQNIIIHACEQSGRCWLPTLHPIKTYDETITNCMAEKRFICEPCDDTVKGLHQVRDIAIVVGPEGGLEEQEVKLALEKGYTPLSLGNNILRTETAATSALSIVHYLLKQS